MKIIIVNMGNYVELIERIEIYNLKANIKFVILTWDEVIQYGTSYEESYRS